MDFLTWEAVVAFVGGVGTICATTWKILSDRRTIRDHRIDELEVRLQQLSENSAVQTEQIANLNKEIKQLYNSFEKLNEILIKLLTDK